jgi:cytochrome c peroxidase
LFEDRHLSADGQISCATCHQTDRAFSDGQPVARGIGGQLGSRNTPALVNASFSTTFSWEGRRTSLDDQVLDPFFNSREHGIASGQVLLDLLAGETGLVGDFQRTFREKAEVLSLEHVALALACFVRSLVGDDSAFDRFMYKGEHAALTDAQRRGLKLFRGRGQCASCHLIGDKEAPLTDGQFHARHLEAGLRRHLPSLVPLVRATPREQLGELIASRPDIAALGRFLVTLDPGDIGRFRTPSLRNVALTGPYMHDGSVPTLARAVEREIYYPDAEVARSVSLTPSETDDLVAFLESLTSTKYAVARAGNPAGGKRNPPP